MTETRLFLSLRLQAKRYLLDKFFFALFQLGGPFVSIRIASRFCDNRYWRKRKLVIVPTAYYKRGFYNLFSYINELCIKQSNLIFFNYASLNQDFFYSKGFYRYWSNFIISGMEARFANFLNWKDVFEKDQQRGSNRQRFNLDTWWIHYPNNAGATRSHCEIGGMVLHKYFFRSAKAIPKIILSPTVVRRDFFLPVPVIAEKLSLFTFMYMLIRIYCFYTLQTYSRRLFWDTRFLAYEKSQALSTSSDVFNFTFTLYGQNYRQMQLWEYASYVDSFLSLPPLTKAIKSYDSCYDPKSY